MTGDLTRAHDLSLRHITENFVYFCTVSIFEAWSERRGKFRETSVFHFISGKFCENEPWNTFVFLVSGKFCENEPWNRNVVFFSDDTFFETDWDFQQCPEWFVGLSSMTILEMRLVLDFCFFYFIWFFILICVLDIFIVIFFFFWCNSNIWVFQMEIFIE